jgi:ABC-type transporter Mla subunit MlaD
LAQRGTDLGNLIDNTQQAAGQINTLVTNNRPQLQALVVQLQSVLGVLSKHQLDLAQGISSAASAITGFSSIGYSGSPATPVSWGNIYFNTIGSSPLDGVLGSCGTFDLVLTQALGPDPLPCSQQNGPLISDPGATPPATGATTAPKAAGTNSSTSAPLSAGNGIAGILGLPNLGSQPSSSGSGSAGLLPSPLGGGS